MNTRSLAIGVALGGLVGLGVGVTIVRHRTPAPTLVVDRSNAGPAIGPASYADALAAARPAVVSVYSTKFARGRSLSSAGTGINDGTRGPERGLGSGVIVSPEGYILTNNHVIDRADELLVLLPDDREFAARIIGSDPKTDVAVIKIEGVDLPHAVLGDSDALRVGDVVFALGNPLDVGQTATMGIVSATGRRSLDLLARGDGDPGYEDFIQTDAAINVGNSGGALVDAHGRLVGINTAIMTTSHGNIGIGFSIPVNLTASVMRSLVATGKVVRGYLGVSTQDLDVGLAASFGLKDNRGVLVSEVTPGSPAAQGGIVAGDVVLSFNDKAVASRDELRLLVAQLAPGTPASLGGLREGKPFALKVTIGRLDDRPVEDLPSGVELLDGVKVAEGDGRIGGLVVVAVDQRSGYAATLPVGTIIEKVNKLAVADIAAAKGALHKGSNTLVVRYRGVRQFISIEMAR